MYVPLYWLVCWEMGLHLNNFIKDVCRDVISQINTKYSCISFVNCWILLAEQFEVYFSYFYFKVKYNLSYFFLLCYIRNIYIWQEKNKLTNANYNMRGISRMKTLISARALGQSLKSMSWPTNALQKFWCNFLYDRPMCCANKTGRRLNFVCVVTSTLLLRF